MAEKMMTAKESARKIKDLKIELLRSPTKKASIKREIARLLTMKNAQVEGGRLKAVGRDSGKDKALTKLEDVKK